MPDFDINSVLSQFGGTEAPKSKVLNFDVDSILKSFGSVEAEAPKEEAKKVVIRTPKPPISGISKEASDELNQTRVERFGGENPRAKLPTTSILDSIAENYKSGKEMFSSAADDAQTGHPYKALGKTALSGLMIASSPVTGFIEGGPEKLADQVFPKPNSDVPRNLMGTALSDKPMNVAGPGDRTGVVLSSAIPIVPGGSAVVRALPKNKMLSKLVEDIGQQNLPAAVAAMKANPRLAPADLSPKVLQSTQELFANGGPQVNYLKNTSDARMSSSKDAVRAIHGADVTVDTVAKLKSLADAAKNVGSKEINPAIKGAGPVSVADTLTAMDNILKPGVLKVGDSVHLTDVKRQLESIRKDLRTSKEYRAEDLHKYQSGLRETADTLLRSATGADRDMGKALMNVRNSLVSDIDKVSPKIKIMEDGVEKEVGSYRHALSNFRDEKHIAESFSEGYESVFSNSKKMENRPEHTKAWFKGLSDHEKEAVREGTRARMDTEIGVAKNGALAGESVTRSDFNREKLKIILGEEEATKRITALEHERAIANTHNKIVEGSQTAMRDDSKSYWKMPTKKEVGENVKNLSIIEGANILAGGVGGVGTAALAVAKTANWAKHKYITEALARENQASYAKYALPTEGPSRDALIKSLEARIPGPKQSLLTRGGLARLVAP